MGSIRAASAVSTEADPTAAVEDAAARVRAELGHRRADLAFVFFSSDHAPAAMEIAAAVGKLLDPGVLLGCAAQGVAGEAREIEDGPAVVVWAASLPNSLVRAVGIEFDGSTETFTGIPQGDPEQATLLILADPYTFPADRFLRDVEATGGGLRVVGGMASGGGGPGRTRLVIDREVWNGGAVGAVLTGGVRVEPLVSQGCSPIGSPATITRAEGNVIHELGGRPPLERIREAFSQAGPRERALLQQGIHIGRVIDEYRTEFGRGDFLIRGVVGANPETGAIAVGDRVEVGQTVQLHVRDAASADEDLRTMLGAVPATPAAVLMFTCNGRGTNLFPAPDHDASAIRSAFGAVPLAGFFCAGEFGPVGGRNFLHGFTASLAMLVDG